MNMVFADSYFFLAQLNPRDEAHEIACEFTDTHNVRLCTTDWVLVEVADALSRPPNRSRFIRFFDLLLTMDDTMVVPASRELLRSGWELYSSRSDKEWSLTDCISFAVMHREGIREALTGDRHVEQAGFIALLR